MMLLGIIALSFCVSTIATYCLAYSWIKGLQVLDYPNERSLHIKPTPRSGGLGILAGLIIGIPALALFVAFYKEFYFAAGAVGLIGIISFLDDIMRVSTRIRFSVHVLAALLFLYGGFGLASIDLPGISIDLSMPLIWLVSVLFLVWMTNLYNFMDGMDGFAGGMAVISFGTLGLLGHLAGDGYYAAVSWVIAAASAGFLVWNFPPARIFMGDTGSSVLGLLGAALSLWADRDGLFPLWLAMLIFAPFVFDATLTLARRTLKGERVWEAHRSHYYQRLVQAGWSHRRTVLWEYGLMLLCGACALYAFRAPTMTQWVIISVVLGACLVGVIGVRYIERRQVAARTAKVFL